MINAGILELESDNIKMNRLRISIIGGGPGGYVAAIRAAQLGAQVTLVEKDSIGGTCLNRGCIPTKCLLHDAGMLQKIRKSGVFGNLIGNSFSPLDAMMARKDKVVNSIVKGVELLLSSHRIRIIKAEAVLDSPSKMMLKKMDGSREVLESDRVIIATGSRVSTPDNLLPDGEAIITSDEALNLDSLPRELLIIGGGYIGIEFATFFNAIGIRVTIIEVLENILTGLDDEMVRNTRRILEQKGVIIHTGTRVTAIEKKDSQTQVIAITPKGQVSLCADKVLLSTGRVPNIGPDVSQMGIDVSAKGIRVNRKMETNMAGIYAIGDVVGGIQLAHVASEEGEIAAENALGMNRELKEHPIPFCVFTHPEIACIGLTEREARERGPVTIGRFPFRSNPTAIIHEDADGIIKVVIDRESDRILGIHLLGHEASTLLSTASNLIFKDVKGREFAGFMQAHPTTPETLKEAFLSAYGQAIHAPKPLKSTG